MEIQQFEIARYYVANYGGPDHTQNEEWKVPVSELEDIVNKLTQFIKNDNIKSFTSLLKDKFIFSQCIRTSQRLVFNTMSYGRGQRESIHYAEHYTAPILEALVVHYPQKFYELYELASGRLEFKKSLSNFSGLDLTNADLTNMDFSIAKFVNTNLTKTKGITLETLNLCESYDFAKLPVGMVPVWSITKAEKVLFDLAKLKEYGRRLQLSVNEAVKAKGELIVEHAQNLITQILITPKHDKIFQEQFLLNLHQHDQIFNHPRDHGIKKIISNIALFILGAGIIYAAALGAHYSSTGRILFLAEQRLKN